MYVRFLFFVLLCVMPIYSMELENSNQSLFVSSSLEPLEQAFCLPEDLGFFRQARLLLLNPESSDHEICNGIDMLDTLLKKGCPPAQFLRGEIAKALGDRYHRTVFMTLAANAKYPPALIETALWDMYYASIDIPVAFNQIYSNYESKKIFNHLTNLSSYTAISSEVAKRICTVFNQYYVQNPSVITDQMMLSNSENNEISILKIDQKEQEEKLHDDRVITAKLEAIEKEKARVKTEGQKKEDIEKYRKEQKEKLHADRAIKAKLEAIEKVRIEAERKKKEEIERYRKEQEEKRIAQLELEAKKKQEEKVRLEVERKKKEEVAKRKKEQKEKLKLDQVIKERLETAKKEKAKAEAERKKKEEIEKCKKEEEEKRIAQLELKAKKKQEDQARINAKQTEIEQAINNFKNNALKDVQSLQRIISMLDSKQINYCDVDSFGKILGAIINSPIDIHHKEQALTLLKNYTDYLVADNKVDLAILYLRECSDNSIEIRWHLIDLLSKASADKEKKNSYIEQILDLLNKERLALDKSIDKKLHPTILSVFDRLAQLSGFNAELAYVLYQIYSEGFFDVLKANTKKASARLSRAVELGNVQACWQKIQNLLGDKETDYRKKPNEICCLEKSVRVVFDSEDKELKNEAVRFLKNCLNDTKLPIGFYYKLCTIVLSYDLECALQAYAKAENDMKADLKINKNDLSLLGAYSEAYNVLKPYAENNGQISFLLGASLKDRADLGYEHVKQAYEESLAFITQAIDLGFESKDECENIVFSIKRNLVNYLLHQGEFEDSVPYLKELMQHDFIEAILLYAELVMYEKIKVNQDTIEQVVDTLEDALKKPAPQEMEKVKKLFITGLKKLLNLNKNRDEVSNIRKRLLNILDEEKDYEMIQFIKNNYYYYAHNEIESLIKSEPNDLSVYMMACYKRDQGEYVEARGLFENAWACDYFSGYYSAGFEIIKLIHDGHVSGGWKDIKAIFDQLMPKVYETKKSIEINIDLINEILDWFRLEKNSDNFTLPYIISKFELQRFLLTEDENALLNAQDALDIAEKILDACSWVMIEDVMIIENFEITKLVDQAFKRLEDLEKNKLAASLAELLGSVHRRRFVGRPYLMNSPKEHVEEAIKWYELALSLGANKERIGDEIAALYVLTAHSMAYRKQFKEAEKYFDQALAYCQSDYSTYLEYGLYYIEKAFQKQFSKKYHALCAQKGITYLEKAAEKIPQADYTLGNIFYESKKIGCHTIKKDIDRAKKHVLKAADDGLYSAQVMMGHWYFGELGLDIDKAEKYFTIATNNFEHNNNDPVKLYLLLCRYLKLNVNSEDFKEIFDECNKLLNSSVELGAAAGLANMYLKGQGVAFSLSSALDMFNRVLGSFDYVKNIEIAPLNQLKLIQEFEKYQDDLAVAYALGRYYYFYLLSDVKQRLKEVQICDKIISFLENSLNGCDENDKDRLATSNAYLAHMYCILGKKELDSKKEGSRAQAVAWYKKGISYYIKALRIGCENKGDIVNLSYNILPLLKFCPSPEQTVLVSMMKDQLEKIQ